MTRHEKIYMLLDKMEDLDKEIKNGNLKAGLEMEIASEEVDVLINEIIDDYPEFLYHGSNIIREAFKIVHKTK